MEPLYTFTNDARGLQARVEPMDDGRYAVRLIDLNTGKPFRPVPILALVDAVEHAGAVTSVHENVNSV